MPPLPVVPVPESSKSTRKPPLKVVLGLAAPRLWDEKMQARGIKEAEGGILFVDEAYRLIPIQKSDDKDYGLEALEEIMSVMDSGKVVVIFADYSEPMKRIISSNEGFCRRVTKFFTFDDFSHRERDGAIWLILCSLLLNIRFLT
ncbi:hypothetical protein CTI12_AA057820 [Artemisia annua]|uniref:ATPase AAA-type core domain-containing protein n=1 Tax=Artemisia annua TaxID=35608 RepID=A0A2U1NUZ4_ARTAN|nr:hypothetical protein CTI12_AA057820 [Artemisia annua]